MEVYIEESFEDDVEINFRGWSEEKKERLIKAIQEGKKYTFPGVSLSFAGDVDVDVEPSYNEGYE